MTGPGKDGLGLVARLHRTQRAHVNERKPSDAFWEMRNGLTERETRWLIRLVNGYWRLRRRRWLSWYGR